MKSLLPSNATDFERALEQVTCRIEQLPVEIADFYNPDTIPEPLIPWLAWEWSLDTWSPDWSEAIKRQLLRNSMPYHRIKGTKQAVADAVQSLGSNMAIKEWWENNPKKDPHYFAVTVDSVAGNANGVLQSQLTDAIDRAKPLRSHYQVFLAVRSRATLTTLAHSTVANFTRLTLKG